jgi:hypothetical protein
MESLALLGIFGQEEVSAKHKKEELISDLCYQALRPRLALWNYPDFWLA